MNFPFLNNPKDLDPSYKMGLDFWDYFRWKKTLSYSRRNTVKSYLVNAATNATPGVVH